MEHWSLIAEACDRKLEKPWFSRVSLFLLGIVLDPLTLLSKGLEAIGISYPPIVRKTENKRTDGCDA